MTDALLSAALLDDVICWLECGGEGRGLLAECQSPTDRTQETKITKNMEREESRESQIFYHNIVRTYYLREFCVCGVKESTCIRRNNNCTNIRRVRRNVCQFVRRKSKLLQSPF